MGYGSCSTRLGCRLVRKGSGFGHNSVTDGRDRLFFTRLGQPPARTMQIFFGEFPHMHLRAYVVGHPSIYY